MQKGAAIEHNIRQLLTLIGENPKREGLKETPTRISRMYAEIFSAYHNPPPKITTFGNDEHTRGLIIDSGDFFSICEHHMMPFFGQYYFGYIPRGRIIGASKIGRVVDHFSRKLQIQENLCGEIVNYLDFCMSPDGCILVMRARHFCKEMRGIRKVNSPFETIEARGILLANDNGCKDEFMMRIQNL